MAEYSQTSPWYNTLISDNYLDILVDRDIGKSNDDPLYEIEPRYYLRPDLLSYDLYGTPKLWWVFYRRNLDVINDPIFDFIPGKIIRLPIKGNLFPALGL